MVTIIIIIILATVTMNLALGDNGLIRQAQLAKNLTANSIIYETESIENLLMYMNEEFGGGSKPEEPEEPGTPTGTIEFEEPEWVGDGTAKVRITTDKEEYELQYQKNSTEGEWQPIESGGIIEGLKHNDTVYGRLWNGTEESDYASISIKDETPPTVSVSASNVTTNSATLTVTANDGESGLADNGRYTYYLGATQKTSNNTSSYTYTGLNPETKYTLKVVVKDNAGKTTEKSTEVTTTKKLATNVNELKEGEYVNYIDGTGGIRRCVVLYGPTSQY